MSRSSQRRVEGALKYFDHWHAGVEMDRHDVEPAGTVCQSMSHEIVECEPRDLHSLARRDRLARLSECPALPRLHFHEHHRLAVAGDDVQFSTAAAVAPGNNCVPAALQLLTGQIFAGFSKRHAMLRHASRHQQAPRQEHYTPATVHHEDTKSTKSTKSSCTKSSS